MSDRTAKSATAEEQVGVRTLLVAGLPLLVVSAGERSGAAALRAALAERGLVVLPALVDVEFPKGAAVGLQLDAQHLRMVDDAGSDLLRIPAEGLDPGWLDEARRLRGSMLVIVRGLELEAQQPAEQLVTLLDGRARAGAALGAIVRFAEERPRLPLIV